jgi:arylsulfatase A-like enzyme
VDLAPTFCALAGAGIMPTCDGTDLTPLLSGGSKPVRQVAVTENVWSKAIRWGQWRMVHYQPEMFPESCPGELYDLKQDSRERHNLFSAPSHGAVVHEGRQLLLEWLIRTARPRTIQMPNLPGDPNPISRLASDGTLDPRFGPAELLRRGNRNTL